MGISRLRCRVYRKRLCRLCGVRGGLLPILHVFRRLCLCGNRCGSLYDDIFALRGWKKEGLGGIEFELNSILVEKWKGKAYRLVVQRQKRFDGVLDLWEGEYTYRCILTNDYESSVREIVEFYNLRGGKERIFYKFIMARLDVKRFGLKATSRIKAFVFKFISVPAKWVRTSRQYVLNIYSYNNAYANVFQNDFG